MRRRGNVISPIDTINTVVEMLQQTDSSVEDGEIVWVRSVQQLFVYRVNSGLTPNGTTVVASLYGNGVWQQITGGQSGGILSQATWFVDPTNGNDNNSGLTAGTALKTNAQLALRWGIGTRLAGQAYTVTWLGSTSGNDPVIMDIIVGPGASLSLKGTTTVALSSTLTGYTATNRGTQVMNALLDTATASFAAFVNKPYTITSGPRAGTAGFIMAATAANTARITTACTVALGVVTKTVPAATDPYTIFNIPTIVIGVLNVQGDPNGSSLFIDSLVVSGQNLSGQLQARTIAVFPTRTSFLQITIDSDQFFATQCLFSGVRMAGPGIYQTAGTNLLQASGSNSQIRFEAGSSGSLDFDFLFQAGSAIFNNASSWIAGTVAFFDAAFTGPCFIDSGANLISENVVNGENANLIWGTNNTGFGVIVKSNGGLLYVTKPTINGGLGAGRESSVGGVDKQWGAVPFNDSGAAATGAIIAVYS